MPILFLVFPNTAAMLGKKRCCCCLYWSKILHMPFKKKLRQWTHIELLFTQLKLKYLQLYMPFKMSFYILFNKLYKPHYQISEHHLALLFWPSVTTETSRKTFCLKCWENEHVPIRLKRENAMMLWLRSWIKYLQKNTPAGVKIYCNSLNTYLWLSI